MYGAKSVPGNGEYAMAQLNDLGIDLGTSNVLIYQQGKGACAPQTGGSRH